MSRPRREPRPFCVLFYWSECCNPLLKTSRAHTAATKCKNAGESDTVGGMHPRVTLCDGAAHSHC